MTQKYTNWTNATTDINKAMIGLISCLDAGYNAWIEIQTNGNQDYPIRIKNPELDKPENWTGSIGIPRPTGNFIDEKFFNETEKDLTQNWIALFGDKEAADNYYKTGVVSKAQLKGMGYCHAVKISDANKLRTDGYEYGYWAERWKPRDNIPYWVVDKSIDKVFVICYNKESVNRADSLIKAGEFLIEYANTLK
jgi:hypothetical protein